MITEPARLRDFAMRYTAAWCSQDPASVASFYSPDGSLRINDAPAAVGRGAIAESARAFMSAFPDLQVLMDDVLVQDGRAVFHWTLKGSNTGPGGTGNRVRISGFEVWTIGDSGLIHQSQGHFNIADYERQKGGA
jgi:predicted ester cyclase